MENQSSEIHLTNDYEFIQDGPGQDLFISSIDISETEKKYINILDLQSQNFNLFELTFIRLYSGWGLWEMCIIAKSNSESASM